MYEAKIRVFYPRYQGRVVLRTEQNWDRDVEAESFDEKENRAEFSVTHDRAFMEYKPCIRDGGNLHWSVGTNKLLLLTRKQPQDVYPFFFSGTRGSFSDVLEVPSSHLLRTVLLRVYLPPGYSENTLKRYPVLYMHDGRNLYFPQEAFMGQEWRVDENLELLNSMNLIDQMIVVGIHAGDRFYEYTKPGYESYGKALVQEIKPRIDNQFRTLTDTSHTMVMGSSLGGVVSFYLAWQWPDVFGCSACMSSTFSYQDNLLDRVRDETIDARESLKFYLDSGWPGDNYEPTLSVATALLERGYMMGKNVHHFAFPLAAHNEASWSARIHLPIQLFAGKLRRG